MNPPEVHEFDEMTEDRPFKEYGHFSTWLHFLKIKRTQMKRGLKIICFINDKPNKIIDENNNSLIYNYSSVRHDLYISKEGKVYKISRDMEVFNGQN